MAVLTNQKWETFAQNLAGGMNYTQAYLNAGYKCTAETARRRGSQLMTNDDILKRFMELARESNQGKVMELTEAKERLSSIGRMEAQRKFVNDEGKEIDIFPTIAEARGAIESIIRMNGGFIDCQKVDLSGEVGIADVIRKSRERMEKMGNDT